jgi:branched-chain amino acid transport system substrate-binding protein
MTQALADAYKAAHTGHRFEVDCFNVGFTFEALLVAADGVKRAGTSTGPELMAAIRAADITDHVMIGGPIKFDDKGQNNNIGSAVIQNRDRTPTVVLPDSVATMKPVLPMPPWQGRT